MKILYVTTVTSTMSFFNSHINMLLDQGHKVDMACNLLSPCNVLKPINPELIARGCKAYNIEFQRSALSKENYYAYKKIRKLIKDEKYDVVHTHTPIASVWTRLACRDLKNVKVMYTAHGFHFYKGSPLLNWLIYYPVEKWLSKYTDILITINKEDYDRTKSSFKAKRVEYVPGIGLDTNRIQNVTIEKKVKRKELGVPDEAFLVLSVGELNKNKNHETVIKAIAKLNHRNIYYLICGQGPLEEYLEKLIMELGVNKQVKVMGFRKDIIQICKASDLFVFPSFREGLSVALMEAMACGLPVVCSDIRGNKDLIVNGQGGYLVKPNNEEGYENALYKFLGNNNLKESFGHYNKKMIKKYELKNVIEELKNIYFEV